MLLGYWTAELGGLNQVVHIWYYGKVISPTPSVQLVMLFVGVTKLFGQEKWVK